MTGSPIKNFALNLQRRNTAIASAASAVTVKVGVPFDIELVLTDASQLILLNSQLQYDTSRLEVMTSEGLPIWSNGTLVDDTDDFTIDFLNKQPGILAISAMPAGIGETINGSGRLLAIRFIAIKSGVTQLVWLPDSKAYEPDPDPDGIAREIDATFKNFDFNVDSAAGVLVITLNIVPA